MHAIPRAVHCTYRLSAVSLLLPSPKSCSEHTAECHLRNNAMHALSNVCDVSTAEQKENDTQHTNVKLGYIIVRLSLKLSLI